MHACFFSYTHLKLTLGVLLTGSTVAMVTYYIGKLTMTCLPMIRHFYDTIIVVSADKETGSNVPSKYKYWEVLETAKMSGIF